MIARPDVSVDSWLTASSDADRLLLVGDWERAAGGASEFLQARYPAWSIATSDSYLAGIAELTRCGARGVLVWVDPLTLQLSNAVTGLREAAGDDAKLILCCPPELEPIARRVTSCGADDYLLYPFDDRELDAALGYSRMTQPAAARLSAVPATSMAELAQLGEVLAHLDGQPQKLLDRIAALVRIALRAKGAMVVVEGEAAMAGDAVAKPVLTVGLQNGENVIGQLSVGEREGGAYTVGDVDKLSHYAAVVVHVLEAADRQRQWQRLSVTDECSGLPNRRYLNEKLDEILAQAGRDQFHVTLLLFDIDDFKTYNDRFGHDAGDEIIRLTGRLFQQYCRRQDIVVRYGGDEFAVVFWDEQGPRVAGSKHPDCALAVLDRFRKALQSQPLPSLGTTETGQLTISGGLATYPWDASTRLELIRRADEALLSAKRAGKNRIFLIGSVE